jgi:hypothetical protein
MPKISALPAATAANLTGVAILPTTDKNTLTVGTTYAQLRTALFAGGTGYASNDPLTAGGLITASAGILLAGGSFATGRIYGDAANNGLVLSSITGGSFDWSVLTPAGQPIFQVPTGTQNVAVTGVFSLYKNVATAGLGVPATYGSGRVGPITNAASGTICTFTPAADGTFQLGANVLVTTSTTHTFTVTVAYTDEGNTGRTLTLTFSQVSGTLLTAITNVTGLGAYEGVPLIVRAKGGTAITIQTAAGGTYTGVVYNASAFITQIAA